MLNGPEKGRDREPARDAIYSPSQLQADTAVDAQDKFVHRRASELVSRVVADIGREGFTPNEREALYLASELGLMLRSIATLRACALSSVEQPLAVWSHAVEAVQHQDVPKWLDEHHTGCVWLIDHDRLLVRYTELVRAGLSADKDLSSALKDALPLTALNVVASQEPIFKVPGEADYLSIDGALDRLAAQPVDARQVRDLVQSLIAGGKVSADCPLIIDEVSHAELVRVKNSDQKVLLNEVGDNLNLDLAPDLSFYSGANCRELYRCAKTENTVAERPVRKNIAYLATQEALHYLREECEAGRRLGLSDVVQLYRDRRIPEYREKLASLKERGAPVVVQHGALERIEFYQYVLAVIDEHQNYLNRQFFS